MKSRLDYIIAASVLVVLFSWLTYTTFWILHSFSYWGMIKFMHDEFTLPAYLAFSFGLVGRGIAALLAIIVVGTLMTKGWSSKAAKLALTSAVLEGVYLMCYLPAGGVGPQTNDWITALEATPPAIVEAIIVPIPLFILAYKLWRSPNSYGELLKWASIAGVGYFFVFWFKFTSQWLATFAATAADWTFFNPGAGFGYVTKYPLNMFEFLLTSVGLFLLALLLLWFVLPLIRNKGAKPNLRGIGLVLTLLGGYFITIVVLYAVFGPVGGLSLWNSYFADLNVDRWAVVLPVLGIPLMLKSSKSE